MYPTRSAAPATTMIPRIAQKRREGRRDGRAAVARPLIDSS
jgi:hypothetical protein